jgi:anti-anti-sigma regulatory factor
MLRITSHAGAGAFALKLEGWLTGAWVDEVDRCWRAAASRARHGRICVDLSEVFFVDDAGRELLTRMYRAGVDFVATGCVMPEIVREISSSETVAGRS